MRFIADENIPRMLVVKLIKLNHNIVLTKRNKSDIAIARQAANEKRIVLTLDKDFTNTILFPPGKFNIHHIDIHPPEKHMITNAVIDLIAKIKPNNFKGLIILSKEGIIRQTK